MDPTPERAPPGGADPAAAPAAARPSRAPAGGRRRGARDLVVGYQRWDRILLLHFEVSPATLRPLVDPRLELDLHDGRAWVSLTPFTMRGARVRLAPPLPALARFHELNLRTYVRGGGVEGLWFLSLDASSTPAVAIARATLGLPYFRARMDRSEAGTAHAYHSERVVVRGPQAAFAASWDVGDPVAAPPGSLDHFLAERYALFSAHAGLLLRVRVRHAPWALRAARVDRLEQSVVRAAGLWVDDRPALAHFSEGRDVEVLLPEVVA
ncbi:MAG TPA: DUF2071 domain-containing protein [Anaeromyxobacter sp.]|nr:DUF2071 domain-containing protein [Anaeromyxobacter sp.]